MRTTKKIQQEVEVTDQITCNKCGKSCGLPDGESNNSWYGLIEHTVRGGYFSKHLEDMTNYTFSLCEPCLSELFDSFLIKVNQREYNFG